MNRVEFMADVTGVSALEQFFTEMAKKEIETRQGQLPEFALQERGYLFDIEFEHGMLFYQTKWAPNTGVIVEIAKHFKVDFKHNFEEYDMQLFGEAVFENGELSVIELDSDDLAAYDFDEATETYLFEGRHYEMVDEIVETLISRKKQIRNLMN